MPATPPQPVIDALQILTNDRAALDGLYGADAAADEALARATNAKAVAKNALDGAKVNFDQDRDALVELIQSTYTSGPPAPPVVPPPPPGPVPEGGA